MQKPYILLDDTGANKKHGRYFKTIAAAHAYAVKHNLLTTHLIYDLSRAPVVTDPSIAIELERCRDQHNNDAETVTAHIDELMEKHGDDYDPWDDIMDLELGYPYDNECDAEIYDWMLNDHLQNGTTHWTYEYVSRNTDIGTSGRDSWQYVVEHLQHLGYMDAQRISEDGVHPVNPYEDVYAQNT